MNKIKLYKHIIQVFGKDKAKIWLTTKLKALDDESPLDYINRGYLGYINDMLIRIEYGVYS